eukprot:tig00021098_g18183.t1
MSAANPAPVDEPSPESLLLPELLSSIFARLDIQDRFRAAAVCRRWALAAKDPPHTTKLELLIAGDVPEGDARWRVGRWKEDFEEACAKRALSIAAATKIGDCGLLEVLATCGARLEVLEIVVFGDPSQAWELAKRSNLERLAPALRSLRLLNVENKSRGIETHIGDVKQVPRLHRLEELGATLSMTRDALEILVQRFPSLRVCSGLSLDAPNEEAGCILSALAAARIRCRQLFLGGEEGRPDFLDSALAARIAAVLRPLEVDAAMGPALLELLTPRLLPDSWPAGALAGLEALSIFGCDLDADALRWLAGEPHAATLRELTLGDECNLKAPLEELYAALERLPAIETAYVYMQMDDAHAPPAAQAAFLDALVASPRLLRAVFAGAWPRSEHDPTSPAAQAYERWCHARFDVGKPVFVQADTFRLD